MLCWARYVFIYSIYFICQKSSHRFLPIFFSVIEDIVLNNGCSFKVPMKWNFSPLFYSRKLRSLLHWFIIFEFKLWSGAQNNFSIPPKLVNSSQNVRHSARGQNMQISTVDVIRCVKPSTIIASEGNKWRSGKFFVTGGPVLASCKTPLTRKALSCLYFRKTKSE